MCCRVNAAIRLEIQCLHGTMGENVQLTQFNVGGCCQLPTVVYRLRMHTLAAVAAPWTRCVCFKFKLKQVVGRVPGA